MSKISFLLKLKRLLTVPFMALAVAGLSAGWHGKWERCLWTGRPGLGSEWCRPDLRDQGPHSAQEGAWALERKV